MKKTIYSFIILFLLFQTNYALDTPDDEANKLFEN